MPAPTGNQYAKGNRGGGRKGYEYEKIQSERMIGLLNKYLELMEKIEKGETNEKDTSVFNALTKPSMKIMDKLHANKQDTRLEIGGQPILPFVIKIIKDDGMKE